jgi:hypothetical protein
MKRALVRVDARMEERAAERAAEERELVPKELAGAEWIIRFEA